MRLNIGRGIKLGEKMVIAEKISGKDLWGIYRTFTNDFALCVDKNLADKWINADLISPDIFTKYNEDMLFSVSMQNKRLEYLPDAESPNSIEDAISFAVSLKKSRDILGDDVDLSESIFYEQYSRILPIYGNTHIVSDDVVLGKWLTGGVPISITKLQDLQTLMSWTSLPQIKKVVLAGGMEVEEFESIIAQNSVVDRRQISEDDFVLYGRKELTDFFNDHVVDIIRRPKEYAIMGIYFPGSIIMYGPPGSGKTYAADALIEFLGWPSFYINSGTIGSKYIHETSKKISDIFNKAMQNSPSIIIIDEMESFLSSRSEDHIYHTEEVGEFLRLLQKAKDNQVLVIAMTNMVDSIDEAVKRRGRFDHVIKVDMPSKEEIQALLEKLFAKMPINRDVNIEKLAKALQGQSMADVTFLVKEAGRRTVKNRKKEIDQSIVDEVIVEIKKADGKEKSIGFKKTDKE